mmetsp:Transcript_5959/g.12526  ORF Transcript_5959/g.12526 Transcript_5959/m.12526 type:complete len:725 (+) Transcript_5959:110-2284(+)|eukprot:CAMPEP_0201149196 /NCGR_PEP_ID=MMETSP0851-20130426/10561_1 /ASSEMBLY_ACC=CAM_ASM_000631 /TAXON_ID=183588 /ORGANISM="Pseudo-nitzschia fraudulenta, Strain WWA7" /LENGTH=724 /DNA_ID=CAMNT_0047425559 /DNA_START=185 /DNA_END=2359 /DNA_ORIENTATION=+
MVSSMNIVVVAQAAFLLLEPALSFVPLTWQGLCRNQLAGLSFSSTHPSRRQQWEIGAGGNVESEVLIEREDEEEQEVVGQAQAQDMAETLAVLSEDNEQEEEEEAMSEEEQEQFLMDESHMRLAIEYAKSQSESASAYPNPTVGAALVASDGQVLGLGCSSYKKDAIQDALQQTGLEVMPLREWCITWPAQSSACWKLRDDLASATLYVTLEPLASRRGETLPPMTQLIELSGVSRVVIGTPDPVPARAGKGSQSLHRQSGLDVSMGRVLEEQCRELVAPYTKRANTKLQIMARTHRARTGRPLGLLHCSVVDSDDIEAFAQLGNAFGKSFGGQTLSFRDFGSYEMAPPPEQIWAEDDADGNAFPGMEVDDDDDDDIDAYFGNDEPRKDSDGNNVIMPHYSQVDAVIGTFPREGNNGPMVENNTIKSRLNGLKWLSTFGKDLPAGVERILVLDATDLENLPLDNADPNLPAGVDVESFWRGAGRKPTRVLLRKGRSSQAEGAARAAAAAAEAAAKAALATKEAIETGEAESAAEAAMEYQSAALAATEAIQKELSRTLAHKQSLQSLGVVVETLNGKDPLDVLEHLGRRNGYGSVVWRAGCWGQRGVQSILDGAFQSVSAHLAVDANGGRFWQQMLAERAVQGACGPESRVKVFCSDDDISLEFCDSPNADGDCVLTKDGKPVRHVRLDCRVALVDRDRPREFVIAPTKRLDRKTIEEEAPWFL